jgi:hypothetical protein
LISCYAFYDVYSTCDDVCDDDDDDFFYHLSYSLKMMKKRRNNLCFLISLPLGSFALLRGASWVELLLLSTFRVRTLKRWPRLPLGLSISCPKYLGLNELLLSFLLL